MKASCIFYVLDWQINQRGPANYVHNDSLGGVECYGCYQTSISLTQYDSNVNQESTKISNCRIDCHCVVPEDQLK